MLKYTKNVGGIDRPIRAIVGVALLLMAVTGTIGVWGYIGIIPLLTAIFSFCPAYTFLGKNTCGCAKD
ncbi:YgaP family membrane protein [Pararhodospirillum photometricum]|uniref:Inner membrane protein YgaP-like transmembrane domain-containing protein n=1 Tax=Pararhodospirillum photometricum DSM 122 TaxID=1150469 RepID=H6SIV2_PARPM|nr:DUF2892 domain-containing protein [Pararhodospirillum photometricum]CCG06729.1 Putative uncharacterized protein [Pararhodospirillum photometricum DSM 122]